MRSLLKKTSSARELVRDARKGKGYVNTKERGNVYMCMIGNLSTSNMFAILESVAEREAVDPVMLDMVESVEEE